MYSKPKRIFDMITGFLCLLSGLICAFLFVCEFIYFDNKGDALKLAVPALIFSVLFIILGFKFTKTPKMADGRWKSKRAARIGLAILCPAFAVYSFIVTVAFVAIAVGTAIGAAFGGNTAPELDFGSLLLTLNWVNVFISAVPFVTNIIGACIKAEK